MLHLFKTPARVLGQTARDFRGMHRISRAYFAAGQDYYNTLGLDKNADQKQIKAAFYKLAKQYHPDVSKGTEEKFKQINEAYETLSDENKRRSYDNEVKYGGAGGFSGNPFTGQRSQGTTGNYHYGRGSNYKGDQNAYQQTYYYTYTDGTGKKKTYSKTSYRGAEDDFNSFYQQFMRDFGQNSNNQDFKNKVYEDIKQQQRVLNLYSISSNPLFTRHGSSNQANLTSNIPTSWQL